MATIRYWDGARWKPILAGGSGPAGLDGKSVNVFGPVQAQPIPERKGDVWLVDVGREFDVVAAEAYLQPPKQVVADSHLQPATAVPAEAHLRPAPTVAADSHLEPVAPKKSDAFLAPYVVTKPATLESISVTNPTPGCLSGVDCKPAVSLEPATPTPPAEHLSPYVYSPISRLVHRPHLYPRLKRRR